MSPTPITDRDSSLASTHIATIVHWSGLRLHAECEILVNFPDHSDGDTNIHVSSHLRVGLSPLGDVTGDTLQGGFCLHPKNDIHRDN